MGRTKFLARAVVVLAVLATAGAVWAAEFFVEAPPTNLPPGKVVRQDLDGTYDETAGTWGNTGIKSAKAPTQGIYSRYSQSAGAKCQYTFVPNETGNWTLDLTWGPTTNGDSLVVYTVYDADGTTVLGTGTLNMDQGFGHHAWNALNKAGGDNVYSFVACQRYKVELYNETLSADGPRMMGDCLRIAKASGCNDTPVVTVQAPLIQDDTVVKVLGVKTTTPAATEVRVYDLDSATPGTPIATAAASGSTVDVTVPALVGGHRIFATQVVNGAEGCTCNAPAVTVGCVAVPVPVLGSDDPAAPQVLAAGGTSVTVLGIDPNATAVTIYADGTQIGSSNQPGNGATPSKVTVTTSALSEGATITAKQQIRVCLSDASAGVVVGNCAQVPAVSIAGMVDAGRTVLRVVGVADNASAVTIYKQGTPDQAVATSSPTKDAKGAVVVTVPALVEGERYYATQTISGLEGCKTSPALRRVMAAGMIEDFEDLTTAVADAQNPFAGLEMNRVWYNAANYASAATVGSVDTLFGSTCLRITDNGWSNGLYAIYDQIIPADGVYHLQVDMLVDEAGTTTPEWLSSYFIGVIKNGTHRPTLGTIASCTIFGEYNGPLTDQQDGATETQAYVTLTATIEGAQAGDSLLIAFSTNVSSYSTNYGPTAPFPSMRVDNIKLNVGPRPCRPEDVGPVKVITTGPLEEGATQVIISGVVPSLATKVRLYDYKAGRTPDEYIILKEEEAPGGGFAADVPITLTTPLVAGQMLVATQTGAFCDPDMEGKKPTSGIVVGSGKPAPGRNTPILLTLGVREEPDVTTIGENGGATGTIEWIGSSTAGAAPQGKLITPSPHWQTVTFNPATDPIQGFSGDGVLTGTHAVLECLGITITGPQYNSGRYVLYIDNVTSTNADNETAVVLAGGFDAATTGTEVMFQEPSNSGSTHEFLLWDGTTMVLGETTVPDPAHFYPNVSTVDDEVFDGASGKSVRVEFQFNGNSPGHWLRLTTFNAANTPNPVVDLRRPITLRVLLMGCSVPFADADGDKDVDQDDFGVFQSCFTGAGGTIAGAACGCMNVKTWNGSSYVGEDTDIDGDDLMEFIKCITGPAIEYVADDPKVPGASCEGWQ